MIILSKWADVGWRVRRLELKLELMIMSGVEDGSLLKYISTNGDGELAEDHWTIHIGRRDDNDLCLRNDTYVSRQHANLHWKGERWWLEDCESTNGSFTENSANYFDDTRVKGIIPIEVGQLFRIGRTWMRIQPTE
jgi:pSer/pThr/pTyr-binding forkhead associated (FHA) protein